MTNITTVGGPQNIAASAKSHIEERKQNVQEAKKAEVVSTEKKDEVSISKEALSLARAQDTARDTRAALAREQDRTLAADKHQVDQLL